jgi:hypothetical protein
MRITRLAAVAVLLLPTCLFAAEPPEFVAPRLTLAATPAAAPFSEGTTYLTLSTSYLGGAQSYTNENFYTASLGLTWYPLNNLGLIAEVPVSAIHQDGPDTAAAGLDLLVRYHFLSLDQFTLYADGGAGFVFSGHCVPTGGTSFNFIERAGVGFTYQLAPHWFLNAGSRIAHLSNAGIRGPNHNPSINLGVEGYAGIMCLF